MLPRALSHVFKLTEHEILDTTLKLDVFSISQNKKKPFAYLNSKNEEKESG